jgi:large subunit ribosomal protein L32e
MTPSKTNTKAPATKAASKGAKDAKQSMTVKRQLRRTRPSFTRHRPDRKTSLGTNWRKPRGLHNKLKDRKKGCGAWISDGYRTPTEVRGTHISGLTIVRVATVPELSGVDAKTNGIVIASVGAKRQLEILAEAKKLGVRVLNHNAEKREKLLTQRFTTKKADRLAAAKEKAAKQVELKGKASKAAKEDAVSDEEKKKVADEIKKEVLTSKEQ